MDYEGKFKVGGVVVCHDACGTHGLVLGDAYTVKNVDNRLISLDGMSWWDQDRFKPGPTTNDAGEDTSMSVDETLEQRGKRYGTFVKHSELSQSLLRTIRTHTLLNDKRLSDIHTEALSMICHKLARIVNGDPNYDDSWRDIAGYATLVEKHINGEDV